MRVTPTSFQKGRRSFRETFLNPLLVPVVLSLMFCWAPLLKMNGVGKKTP